LKESHVNNGTITKIAKAIIMNMSNLATLSIDFFTLLSILCSMPAFSKRLIYALSNKLFPRKFGDDDQGANSPEGKLIINFARTKKSPFDIKSESSYNAYLSKGALVLGVKRQNYIAWVDIPNLEFQDQVIEAKLRLNNLGNYAATGIIFRIMDDCSYYMALVSSKGYFRLDVVKDNSPKTLIAWTEISDFNGINIDMKIITYGANYIFLVNGKWLGEVMDNAIASGRIGFVLASYNDENNETETDDRTVNEDVYICKAMLDCMLIDTRSKSIEENYKTWTSESNINAEGRLRLAETYAVMGDPVKSLEQIDKAWKRRDEVISMVAEGGVRTKKELLLAARMNFRLGHYSEADEHIDSILDQWPDSPEGKFARTEKMKILNELGKFEELKQFALANPFKINKDIDYYTLLARCHWELNDYTASAESWDKAFELNGDNGVYAANAANAFESAGKKKSALERYIAAGKIFLNEDNKAELNVIMPKLAHLGKKSYEARALAGKWAYSIEDYTQCVKEFETAHSLRNALKPRPKADPAVYYLWGLVLSLYGKNRTAIRLLDKAVKLAPDYGLFRFKLNELKLLNGIKDSGIAEEFKTALIQIGDDPQGKMTEHAGNLLLNAGYSKDAKYFFDLLKKN